MEPKSTYSGNDSYFDGRDKELDASYLCRKLCKKKYQLEFEKGEIIIAQGEDVDACYYLEKATSSPTRRSRAAGGYSTLTTATTCCCAATPFSTGPAPFATRRGSPARCTR